MSKKLIIFILSLSLTNMLFADWSFNSEDYEYRYYTDLKGETIPSHLIYRPLTEVKYSEGFNILPISLLSSFNSAYAQGSNDGAPWQGRGFNGRGELGVSYSNDWISLDLVPEFWIAQNSDFEIIDTVYSSGYGDYYNDFDNLQRYGNESIYDINFGQSSIDIQFLNLFSIGLSTKNFKFGSSKYNPIIMSNHAQSIPNLSLGSKDKIPTKIGSVEFRMIYGQLNESDFYDGGSPDDKAFFSSLILAYEPSFIPGLSLGVDTLYYKPWDNIETIDSIGSMRILYGAITSAGSTGANSGATGASGSDDTDQVASVVMDWHYPGSTFHAYLEWARNDYSGGWDNFLLFPEHSQGLTVGFSKLLEFKIGDFLLSYEFTELAQERDKAFHAAGPWYRHDFSGYEQGYSNEGQVFGAAIGPGSNSQTAEITYIREKQKYQFRVNRTLYDNDYYYNVYVPTVGLDKENHFDSSLYANRVELNFGLKTTFEFDSFDLLAGIELSNYMNHNYKPGNDVFNFYAQLGIRYHF